MWKEMSYNQFELTFTEKLETSPEDSEDYNIEEDYDCELNNKEKAKGVFI